MTDDEITEQKIADMKLKSAQLANPTASLLPHDPLLTSDGAFMRTYGITPMEFLWEVMLGHREATPHQITSARTLMTFAHRPQQTKVQTEVTVDAEAQAFAKALSFASREELVDLKARVQAQKAESAANTVH